MELVKRKPPKIKQNDHYYRLLSEHSRLLNTIKYISPNEVRKTYKCKNICLIKILVSGRPFYKKFILGSGVQFKSFSR